MKLSRIPGHEPTAKVSFTFKKSTTDMLARYQALYTRTTGLEVAMKDVVEQMLLDFMSDDKAFQKELRTAAAAAATAPTGE